MPLFRQTGDDLLSNLDLSKTIDVGFNVFNTVTHGNGKGDGYFLTASQNPKGTFEFLAENTKVEWGWLGDHKGNNYIGTSHDEKSTSWGGQMLMNDYYAKKPRFWKFGVHSHSPQIVTSMGSFIARNHASGFLKMEKGGTPKVTLDSKGNYVYEGDMGAMVNLMKKGYAHPRYVYDAKTKNYIFYNTERQHIGVHKDNFKF